jgi:hypothetical protein
MPEPDVRRHLRAALALSALMALAANVGFGHGRDCRKPS